VLRNPPIRALLVAQVISTSGTQMTFLALPWFVLTTTGSAARMGAVLAAELVPVGIFGIPSGTLVARLGARRTMLLCDAARAPLIAAIPVLHWTGVLTFPLLLAVVFCVGAFNTPYLSSRSTLLPEVLGEDEGLIAQATSLFEGGRTATTILGPVVGGLLIGLIGPASVLVVDGVSYLCAFVLVGLFVRVARIVHEQTPDARGVLAGLRFLLRDRLLGPVALTAIGLNLTVGSLVASLPVLVYLRYDRDPHVVGWLFAASGVGSVLGSIGAYRIVRRFPPLKLAGAAMIASALPLWLLAVRLPWAGVAAVLLAFSFCLPFVNAPMTGVITVRTPAALRPKVLTALFTTVTLANPVGLAASGPAVQAWGPRPVYLVLAAVFATMALLYAAVVIRHDETPELAAAALAD
jgi:predicted MFS family arabinose efflux permease